ncbi:ATPase P [Candidatus Azambacteria bacterium RIFCSPHIGHO2_02_FULL_52_12]|uniref:ATPase P n=1 Tax=Candidatus Azambacteria bacterium RIFCSPLOWO2_01_FULL_46_25 TaxID=1797298 RepID=A0A1F5BUC8_9BACT|nr:MAG: ATPase P [Candidatus Azambacteria bacterium RIFCSPHIGHO2_02_FULL_52_12]OGD34209.1 MAG: ATPase P [Candidatus Azambacteria bacterium RIFCSPLOWO2_01_FULL_46_25]OGD37159.1 MAG: ATPase P [Candidatus Azambacteria bacterium RIFCSPHIGHO2_01_FULL_51_74]
MEADMRRRFFVSLALSIPTVLYSSLGTAFLGPTLPAFLPANWMMLLLTTPVVFWAGSIFITGTYYSLKARKLNMSVLIATGVLTAYIASVLLTVFTREETFFEAAAMLVAFVLFGHWMEMKSRRGTFDALHALFDLVPPKATVLRDGTETLVLTAEIAPGDRVVLKPGDKIPVDGVVVSGESSVDESLVTGESMPVVKKIGDSVIGGSLNTSGALVFQATKIGSDTVLAQIAKLVQTAQNSKAPGQRIADSAAAWLVVLALGSGIATFLGWYVIGGSTLLAALTFAISAVVIACPDALGLATPTAVAVGTGIGAKYNILIKDAATLENTSKINAVVLDKTGTLTQGKPVITRIIALAPYTEEEVVRLEASLEAKSNHPIALALLAAARQKNIMPSNDVEKFEALGGHGMRGMVEKRLVLVGTERLMRDNAIDMTPLAQDMERLLDEGNTVALLAVDGKAAGVVGIADAIKPTAKKAVAGMRALGLEVAMITGDHPKIAQAVARELGITRVFAQVLPQDKASYVKKLQEEGKFVAMVGDGINDAPALAEADIGIAIGAGTDVAIETANIVLMRSDPADVLAAITLSKATVRTMKQNLFWAAIYNILAIPVAAGVFYPSLGWSLRPEISALLMSASSIIVAANAVLLKRIEPKLKVK